MQPQLHFCLCCIIFIILHCAGSGTELLALDLCGSHLSFCNLRHVFQRTGIFGPVTLLILVTTESCLWQAWFSTVNRFLFLYYFQFLNLCSSCYNRYLNSYFWCQILAFSPLSIVTQVFDKFIPHPESTNYKDRWPSKVLHQNVTSLLWPKTDFWL